MEEGPCKLQGSLEKHQPYYRSGQEFGTDNEALTLRFRLFL